MATQLQLRLPLIEQQAEPEASVLQDPRVVDASERVAKARLERQQQKQFRQELSESMSGRLGRVTFTRNRSTLISSRFAPKQRRPGLLARTAGKDNRKIDVRVQRVFAAAAPSVVSAVAEIALGEASDASHQLVQEYFASVVQEEASAEARGLLRRPRPIELEPQGVVYDLREIRDSLLPMIGEPVEVQVTWGKQTRKNPRRRQRTVLLGVYIDTDQLIRLHPILDRLEVPRFVVESVMYHELLHAVLPIEHSGGRRCVHTAEFKRRESLFPQFEEAEVWIDRHIFKLLHQSH